MKNIPDREHIVSMYVDEGYTTDEIGQMVGLSHGAVHSILKVRGVKLRTFRETRLRKHQRKMQEYQASRTIKIEASRAHVLAAAVEKTRVYEENKIALKAAEPVLTREERIKEQRALGGDPMATFGMLGKKQSDYQKQRARERALGNKNALGHKLTPEHKAKLAAVRRALPGTNLGRKFTEEHKEKLRQANLGKKHVFSAEGRARYDAARANKILPLQDTLPERLLQAELTRLGIAFEKHVNLPGHPDIFIAPNICIFADGDYWHRRPEIAANDAKVNAALAEAGYRLLRFWEKDIQQSISSCIGIIQA